MASVKPAAMHEVWDVLFQIEELEVGLLDRLEGYNPNVAPSCNSYIRKELRVLRNGDEREPFTACTYVGNPQPGKYIPDKDYRDQIIKGAKFWHLPEAYIHQLETIEVSD